jgi:enamine deaminase RidA (YjgF/YER057c/UK114 family)
MGRRVSPSAEAGVKPAVLQFHDRPALPVAEFRPKTRQREGEMPRRLISSGSSFEKSIGYSRAVVDGDWVLVSGTTGFDYATMTIQEDVVAQCEQALRNIEAALKQANCTFADVVRVHYLMTSAADFERCWPAMGAVFGEVRPSCTAMVVGLVDPRMKIEIEVTALRRRAAARPRKAAVPKRAKSRAPLRKGPRRKK